MELLYAFGIVCIQFLQERLADFEWHLDVLNRIFNPYNLMEYTFPLTCAVDSVFGAQLLLSVAFGGWCNTMLKWILVEDRPFWWVRETTYYSNADRPTIRQSALTCETGPGSPSGHCAAAATIFMLLQMWSSHIIFDMQMTRLAEMYCKIPLKMLYFFLMSSVGIARMYVGAHFPHQCIMGAMIGSFLSPTVCLFITDPYLFRNNWTAADIRRAVANHVAWASIALAMSVMLATIYLVLGIDLHWSTRMAFRWCQYVDHVSIKSSPIFSIVQSTSSLMGWAIAVTPDIAKYRHYTRRRSHVGAVLATALAMYSFKRAQDYIPNRRLPFYILHFVLGVVKPYVYLRMLPKAAMAMYVNFHPSTRQASPQPAPAQPPAQGPPGRAPGRAPDRDPERAPGRASGGTPEGAPTHTGAIVEAPGGQ